MIIDKFDYRIADVLKGAKAFIDETGYPITYDEQNALDYIWEVFNQPDVAILVHYTGDVLSGWAIVATETEFHREKFGYIMKFYVMKNSRGTMVARNMAQEIVNWFDKNECVVSFATPTANIGQSKMFINLLSKYGFVYDGFSLLRKHNVKN